MATVLSDLITSKDAVPVVRESSDQVGGYLRETAALATVSATIPSADIVHLIEVPVEARVSSLKLSAADATTALAADIGIYTDDGDGTYTVKDADFFASALDFSGGPFINLETVNESAVNTATKQTQPLYYPAET